MGVLIRGKKSLIRGEKSLIRGKKFMEMNDQREGFHQKTTGPASRPMVYHTHFRQSPLEVDPGFKMGGGGGGG